jgi:hypothetical protein
VGRRPDANRAGDLTVADSFAQALGELHGESIIEPQ